MNVITLKNYPYIGVGGTGKVEEDEDLKPLENAKVLGQKIIKETVKDKMKHFHRNGGSVSVYFIIWR